MHGRLHILPGICGRLVCSWLARIGGLIGWCVLWLVGDVPYNTGACLFEKVWDVTVASPWVNSTARSILDGMLVNFLKPQ
jgi:hypothetical protein